MQNTDKGFQIPDEMRELLDRGVNQAREGFDKIMKVAGEAAGTLEKKSGAAQEQARELQRRTISYTEQNVSAAFDLAAKMVKAGSLEEVMRLQNEYLTQQFATLRSQIQEAGHVVQSHGQAVAADIVAETRSMQAQAKEALEKGVAAVKAAGDMAAKPQSRGKKG